MKNSDIMQALAAGNLWLKVDGRVLKVRPRKAKEGEKGITVYVGFNTPMVIGAKTAGLSTNYKVRPLAKAPKKAPAHAH